MLFCKHKCYIRALASNGFTFCKSFRAPSTFIATIRVNGISSITSTNFSTIKPLPHLWYIYLLNLHHVLHHFVEPSLPTPCGRHYFTTSSFFGGDLQRQHNVE